MRRFLIIPMMTMFVLAAGISCRRGESARTPAAAIESAFEVRKTYGAGPVTFTVELSAWSITTAETLKCRMTLDVAKGYEADFPDIAFPDDVPGAILTDYQERESSAGERRIVRRDFEIEPEYEGQLALPRLEVYSHRAGEVKEDVIETDPLEVTVKPSRDLAADVELKPVRGLITIDQIEAQRRRLWPWIVGGVMVLATLAVWVVYWARRPRRVPPPPPAHEVALKRLRQLAERGLIAAGEAEAFFVEVTAIVRDYIEQRFGVRAPEQTTEEFLARMATAPAVARHRQVLEPFLVAADEVKFACLRADSTLMQRAFDTAEQFVTQSSTGGDNRA